jgi:transposase
LAKRLEQGGFRWPRVENGVMRLTPAQLSALLEGLDWTRARASSSSSSTARSAPRITSGSAASQLTGVGGSMPVWSK